MKRLSSLIILFLLIPTLCFGAFPTTGYLDQFNRANENPLAGSWSATPSFQLVSNAIFPLLAPDESNYANWGSTFSTNNFEIYCTIANKGTAPDWIQLQQYDLFTDNGNFYFVMYQTQAGAANDIVRIYRSDLFSATLLGATITQECTNGDSLGYERIGSVIKAYWKVGAGAWADISSGGRTDSTYTITTSDIWINIYTDGGDLTFSIDDFGGGTVVSGGAAPRQGQIVWIE
jgi:hypothetical protein